jgi:2-haloacid dehalogenase
MSAVKRPKAILFDVFGTVVDWRSSLIEDIGSYALRQGVQHDWERLVDDWRAAYVPSMRRVSSGEVEWTALDDLHRMSLDRLVDELNITELSEADLTYINLGWHRLKPWPDAVAGLERLKRDFVIGPLSNGTVSLLVDLAKFGGLPWDVIFGSDMFRHYKPDPEIYLGACELLDLLPSQVMLAAAHNGDLTNARRVGLQTAYFPRPLEYGTGRQVDVAPSDDWEILATDIGDLAAQLET